MKRKILTLSDKRDIVKSLENGVSVTCLAKKYGIAKSTVCAIKNKKTRILSATTQSISNLERKTLKAAENPQMERELYKWFCKRKSSNIHVTTEQIKTKAKRLNNILKETNSFCASDGWLQKFKLRFEIGSPKVSAGKLSKNHSILVPFQQEIQSILTKLNLTYDQIYHADETVLFWRLLPKKTLENECISSAKKNENLTFLACTNVTGEHKVKPLILGKVCFENFELNFNYDYLKEGAMTADIFKNWFHTCYVPEVKKYLNQKSLPENAILLLDNALSHPPKENLRTDDGKIFAVYIPPNVTPLIKQMDQNIIKITKLYYRSNLLSSILSSNSKKLSNVLNGLTMKDAVINIMLAWNRLEIDTIRNCWKNILNIHVNNGSSNNSEGINKTIKEVQNLLLEVNKEIKYSKDEILEWNEDNLEEQSDNEDNMSNKDPEENKIVKLSSFDVLDAFNKVIMWSESNNTDLDDLLVLRKCRDKALKKLLEEKRTESK